MADRVEVDRMVDELMALAEEQGRRIRVATGGPVERPLDGQVPDVTPLLRESLREAIVSELGRRDAGVPVLLWLDDVRPAPAGWVHARSVNEAVAVMEAGKVAYASLDHDLGDFAGDGGDGAHLTDWMALHDFWPSEGLRVHSSNPVGVATMLATADRHSGLSGRFGSSRGSAPEGGWPPALMG